jgi:hypothetical protein
MGPKHLAIIAGAAVWVLLLLANQGQGQDKKEPDAEFKRPAVVKRLEELLDKLGGIKVKMKGLSKGGDDDPQYWGSFKSGNKMWAIMLTIRKRRCDLEVGTGESYNFRRAVYVSCKRRQGIQETAVKELLRGVK